MIHMDFMKAHGISGEIIIELDSDEDEDGR